MKPSLIAVTSAVLLSTGVAIGAPSGASPMTVRELVPYLEARYGGEVVFVALDAWGDKAPHYHVDLHYPVAGTAKLDVDAATGAIAARVMPRPEDSWTTSLAGASAYAATQLGGQVLTAELDSAEGVGAHYDVDVRLPHGGIARMKVDPRSRGLGWRTPPVIAE